MIVRVEGEERINPRVHAAKQYPEHHGRNFPDLSINCHSNSTTTYYHYKPTAVDGSTLLRWAKYQWEVTQ